MERVETTGAIIPPIKKKSPTKQIPLTFKCTNDLEMDLFIHLTSKRNRGAYIKDLLINEMLKERPDLSYKYNVNPAPRQTIVVAPEPEPIPAPQTIKAEPPKVKRGGATMNMF